MTLVGEVSDVECGESSWSGSSRRVDIGWWNELDPARVDKDVPALAMNVVVATRAEHDAVCQVGVAAPFPPADVVGFAVFGWGVAFGASTVSFEEGEALCWRKQSLLAAKVEDFAVAAQHGGDDSRIPCETA